MSQGLQLSARSVASLLASIFGPSFYDDPRFGRGDLGRRLAGGPHPIPWLSGPLPDPWLAVMLNPQPLPPEERHALTLADAHILELLQLDRIGTLFGGEVAERAVDQALRTVAEIDELCPRWPRWPKHWPPPPPPPFGREEMTRTELFLFGVRFLAAAELAEGRIQEGLTQLGEKALRLGVEG